MSGKSETADDSGSPGNWRSARADDVQVGDVVRTQAGDVVTVSRIETEFFGRPGMLAFIEDTADRWYKRPVAADATVEVLVAEGA
jgi:hypothetical protein